MYSSVSSTDVANFAARLRLKRLNKPSNNWVGGIFFDLLFGAFPWIFGVALAAVGLTSIYKNVSSAQETFALFNSPVAIAAIATFSSFLLVGKQATNLSNNNKIIGEFGNLSGSLVNICLFLKSQISSGKSVEFLTLSDGAGGFFQTTRVGLVCASVCYVVKYEGRKAKIQPEGLPLGQDKRLLASYTRLTYPTNGSPGMTPFMACILMIGEILDDFDENWVGSEPSAGCGGVCGASWRLPRLGWHRKGQARRQRRGGGGVAALRLPGRAAGTVSATCGFCVGIFRRL